MNCQVDFTPLDQEKTIMNCQIAFTPLNQEKTIMNCQTAFTPLNQKTIMNCQMAFTPLDQDNHELSTGIHSPRSREDNHQIYGHAVRKEEGERRAKPRQCHS